MKKLPIAKSNGVVVQRLDKEVLIYDLNTHKAFNLNETSTIIYHACDGKTTFDELRIKHKFTDDLIFLALDELKEENLLEKTEDYTSPFKNMSRREAIRRVGFASMIALPVVASLVAPTAAMAQSATCGGGTCECAVDSVGGTCEDPDGCSCTPGSGDNITFVACPEEGCTCNPCTVPEGQVSCESTCS